MSSFYSEPDGRPLDTLVDLAKTVDFYGPDGGGPGGQPKLTAAGRAVADAAKDLGGGLLAEHFLALMTLQHASGGSPVSQQALIEAAERWPPASTGRRHTFYKHEALFLAPLPAAGMRVVRGRSGPRPPTPRGYGTRNPVVYLLLPDVVPESPTTTAAPAVDEAPSPRDPLKSAPPLLELSPRPRFGAGGAAAGTVALLLLSGGVWLTRSAVDSTTVPHERLPSGDSQVAPPAVLAAPCNAPRVDGVTPISVEIGVRTTFTVRGDCLPDTTTAWIANCRDLTLDAHRRTEMIFSCVPDFTVGIMGGVVKDRPAGTGLLAFLVDVSGKKTSLGRDCPSGNGRYCGGRLGLDPSTLYLCVDAVAVRVEICRERCQTRYPPLDDLCAW